MTPYYSPAPLGNNTHAAVLNVVKTILKSFKEGKVGNILLKKLVESNSNETLVETNM
jgi:hypothetical protein